MTARILGPLVVAAAVSVAPVSVQREACDGRTEHRLDQESYISLTDRVYVYAPDVQAVGSSGGWQRFDLRVLVSAYRAPLLLPRGLLKAADLQTLLGTRPDIKVSTLAIAGHDPKAGGSPSLSGTVTVADGERPRKITIRASRVVPVSGGTDHLFVLCTAQ